MDLEITVLERVIHLALFVVGGIVVALIVVAALERIARVGNAPEPGSSEGPRVVRGIHIGAAIAVFTLLFAAERVYHATV